MTRIFSMTVILTICASVNGWCQCAAPAHGPTVITFTDVKGDGFKGSFVAAAAATGEQAANAYLVLVTEGIAQPDQPPVSTETYTANNVRGNSTIVQFNSNLTFTVSKLKPETVYTITVYAANGTCYNTAAAVTNQQKTGKALSANTTEPAGGSTSSKLSTLLNFNFAGNQNGWTNLTPIVFYGWSITGRPSIKGHKWGSTFQVGPYVGSTISAQDSTSYIPSIMLPGNAGVEMNYFLTFFNEEKFSMVISPFNLGLKVISGFKDTSLAIVQHNIRHSIGFRYGDYLTISFQYTTGWHNATTNSEENYFKIFPSAKTKVGYLTIGATMRLSNDLFPQSENTNVPIYFHINWRTLTHPSNQYNLPNSRFISVGLVTDLNLKSGANPGLMPKAPNL